MSTRITSARTVRVRLSTGRAAEIRALLSPRTMLRAELVDEHDLADLDAALSGELDWSDLPGRLSDAIALHVSIDPDLYEVGLGVLDDDELAEIVAAAWRAWLAHRQAKIDAAIAAAEAEVEVDAELEQADDDEDAEADDLAPLAQLGLDPNVSDEVLFDGLGNLKGKLPESKAPGSE